MRERERERERDFGLGLGIVNAYSKTRRLVCLYRLEYWIFWKIWIFVWTFLIVEWQKRISFWTLDWVYFGGNWCVNTMNRQREQHEQMGTTFWLKTCCFFIFFFCLILHHLPLPKPIAMYIPFFQAIHAFFFVLIYLVYYMKKVWANCKLK